MPFQIPTSTESQSPSRKGRSLTFQLGKRIALVFSLSVVLILFSNFLFTLSMLRENTYTTLYEDLSYYEDIADKWMAVRMEHLNIIKHQIEGMSPTERTQQAILRILTDSTGYGAGLGVISDYVVYPDNTMICGDGWVPEPGYNPTGKEYYTAPARSGQSHITSPYVDATTGKFVITISLPLSVNGQLYAVLCRDLYIDELQTLTYSSHEGTAAYLYLLDSQGNILTHRNQAYSATVDHLQNAAQLEGMEFLGTLSASTELNRHRDYDGQQKYFLEKTNQITGWVLGLAYPVQTIADRLISQLLLNLLVSATALSLSLALVIPFLRRRLSPIRHVVDAAQELAQGSLDSVSYQVDSDDEIGQLAETFRQTSDYLRSIIGELAQILSQIAAGELDVRPQCEYRGDFRQIHTAILRISDTFSHIIGSIRTTSDQVTSNARQLAEGAQRLSVSTHEQDIRFGPVADGCDLLGQVVNQNAERCRTAGRITAEVMGKLGDSNRQMGEMTDAMHRISDSSRQISTINKAIEDIAFQTNILALNAAVEAARAGTAGKGFAVVADEVRSLAAKSAEAAQNTTELIDHSVRMVDNGTGISHATADSLRQAVEISQQISQLIQEIVTTSEEQTTQIAFILKGIREVADLTMGDSHTAEQNTALSTELSSQAQTLRELVAHFHPRSH